MRWCNYKTLFSCFLSVTKSGQRLFERSYHHVLCTCYCKGTITIRKSARLGYIRKSHAVFPPCFKQPISRQLICFFREVRQRQHSQQYFISHRIIINKYLNGKCLLKMLRNLVVSSKKYLHCTTTMQPLANILVFGKSNGL